MKINVDVICGDRAIARVEIVEKIFSMDEIFQQAGIKDTAYPTDEEEEKYYAAIDALYATIENRLTWTRGARVICKDESGTPDGDYIDEYEVEFTEAAQQ